MVNLFSSKLFNHIYPLAMTKVKNKLIFQDTLVI